MKDTDKEDGPFSRHFVTHSCCSHKLAKAVA